MEQPLTLHWQSPDAYYTALLTPDLFGGWVLVTASGQRSGRGGRVHHKPLPSYEKGMEAVRRLRRRKRDEGYTLCSTGFMELDDLSPHNPSRRIAQTSALLRTFSLWELPPDTQASLLDVTPRTLESYLDGVPLADEPVLLNRAGHLLAIQKALRLLFAGDNGEARAWLRDPHPRFDGASPLSLMLSGLDGLVLIRGYLEAESDRIVRRKPSSAKGTNRVPA